MSRSVDKRTDEEELSSYYIDFLDRSRLVHYYAIDECRLMGGRGRSIYYIHSSNNYLIIVLSNDNSINFQSVRVAAECRVRSVRFSSFVARRRSTEGREKIQPHYEAVHGGERRLKKKKKGKKNLVRRPPKSEPLIRRADSPASEPNAERRGGTGCREKNPTTTTTTTPDGSRRRGMEESNAAATRRRTSGTRRKRYRREAR